MEVPDRQDCQLDWSDVWIFFSNRLTTEPISIAFEHTLDFVVSPRCQPGIVFGKQALHVL